jgi:hypothetical protein
MLRCDHVGVAVALRLLTVEMVSAAVVILASVALVVNVAIVAAVDIFLGGDRRVLNSTAAKTDDDYLK